MTAASTNLPPLPLERGRRTPAGRLWKRGLGVACGALCLLLYLGFFFPDDHTLATVPKAKPMLWTARIGIPLGALVAAWLRRRHGRLEPGSLLLLATASLAGAAILYVVADQLYARSYARALHGVHPYLQVDPPLPAASPTMRPGAGFRIFCLGGSTTEFTDSSGRGWPERLQERLRARYGAEVEVHNLGRHWYTSLHSLLNYHANLRAHRPQLVLVMHGVNDLLQNADFSYFSRGPFRDDYGHFHGPLSRLTRRRSLLQANLGVLRALWFAPGRELLETDSFPGLLPFQRNLRTLALLARADGVQVVLLTQPHLMKPGMSAEEQQALYMLNHEAVGPDRRWSPETARRGFVRYGDAVRALAAAEALPLIDVEATVPKTLEYFTDEVHYTARGYDRVAEVIDAGLEHSGVLPPGPRAPAPGP